MISAGIGGTFQPLSAYHLHPDLHRSAPMLDAVEAKLTKTGTVTVRTDGRLRVIVEGFEGDGCSCRDVAALAMACKPEEQ